MENEEKVKQELRKCSEKLFKLGYKVTFGSLVLHRTRNSKTHFVANFVDGLWKITSAPTKP